LPILERIASNWNLLKCDLAKKYLDIFLSLSSTIVSTLKVGGVGSYEKDIGGNNDNRGKPLCQRRVREARERNKSNKTKDYSSNPPSVIR
jgi:hypothetical protein